MLVSLCFMLCFATAARCDGTKTEKIPGCPAVRSIFSTSTDWEAVTGLRLNQYKVIFGRDRTVTNVGVELYYLDAFPCYGQTESVRAWISPSRNFAWDKDNFMRITCLFIPKTMQFAYRPEVTRNASQARTKGILTCETTRSGGDIMIHLENCVQGEDWKDMR